MVNMIDFEISTISFSFLLVSLHKVNTIFYMIIHNSVTHLHALIIRRELFPATSVNSLSIASCLRRYVSLLFLLYKFAYGSTTFALLIFVVKMIYHKASFFYRLLIT